MWKHITVDFSALSVQNEILCDCAQTHRPQKDTAVSQHQQHWFPVCVNQTEQENYNIRKLNFETKFVTLGTYEIRFMCLVLVLYIEHHIHFLKPSVALVSYYLPPP